MRKKVVVVDSTVADQKTIVQTIDWQKLNCEVVGQAGDGTAGRRIIFEERPDILISDIRIPGENGLQLADWMLGHIPHAKTILTTESRSFEIARQAIHLKVHAMVMKPLQNAELLQAVQTASEQLDHRSFERHSFLISSEATDSLPIGNSSTATCTMDRTSAGLSLMKELERFDNLLESAGPDELNEYMQRLMARIAAGDSRSMVVVKGLLHNLCLAAVKYYFRITRDEYIDGRSIDQIIGDVDEMTSLKKAFSYIMSLVNSIKETLHQDSREYSPVIKEMLDFIHHNYNRNISLTAIADQFGLSTSHVSRTIRTATGVNFTDLVARIRIESAKRLLKEGKYKVNEVGEKVGFKEYSYFYQVFKRIEGVAPKEYIQSGKLS